MSLSEITSGLAAAMDETKAKLNDVKAQIDAKKHDLIRVNQASPHTDDIVAAFERGLANSAASFEQRLGWFLNAHSLRTPEAAGQVQRAQASVLMVGSAKPNPDRPALFPHSGLGEHQRDIDVAAVTYFLRDKIAAELPALVRKLCPGSDSGIRQAERVAKARAIEAELATLEAERQRLTDEINKAIMAVGPRGSAA